MAFVRQKIKKGNPYFYLVESKRVGSSVSQKILEYIGPLDKLMQFASDSYNDAHSDKLSFKSYSHGSVTALFYAAQLIGIEDIMNSVFKKKTIKGLPRSRVLLLSMIHRACDPDSKRAFAGWASKTSLPYHLGFKPGDLDSQAFWEAMDGITEEQLKKVQRMITERIIDMYHINTKTFHLDYTNYFTFIDSKNNRCFICARGHNKQKRDDLRQFSLAMLTSYSLQTPMFWELYEGNKNDKSEFSDFTSYIEKEMTALHIEPSEVTLVFDGGSNSEDNFQELPFHVICAHSMAGHKYLYDIDIDNYQKVLLEDGHERLAYRVDDMEFSGLRGTGILTYSATLKEGQVAQLERDLGKVNEEVHELNEKLKNPRCRIYTSLRKQKADTERIIKETEEYNRHLKEVTTVSRGRKKKEKEIPVWDEETALGEIVRDSIYKGRRYISEFTVPKITYTDGIAHISLLTDEMEKSKYIKKYYGKKLTCTDHSDWTTKRILSEYNQQECIENNIFKVSKDTDHFAVRPQYHWTDDKIAVHTFICLCSITIAEVLRMELEKHHVHMTKHALLDHLSEIHDGWIFRCQKKADRVIEELDDEHQELWNAVTKVFNIQ